MHLLYHMVKVCCFVRNWKTVSHIGSTFCILTSNELDRIPIAPHPYQYLVVLVFWIGHSSRCIVVSHCSFTLQFLMTYDVEHFFAGFFAVCISSLMKCRFSYFAHLLIRNFVFLLNFKNSLCILDISTLLGMCFADISSQYYLSSLSLNDVFCRVGFFFFNDVKLNYFFHGWCLCFFLKSYHYIQSHLDCLLCYLLGILQFCILHLGLWSILSYLLWKKDLDSFLLHVSVQFFQYHL